MDDPLHADLGNALNGSAFTMLAQQHAEHRRLRRIDAAAFAQVQAGIGRVRRQQQLASASRAAQDEDKIVCAGLIYFADARTDKGLKLVHDRSGNNTV
ncbi:hypothetical protein D3C80_1673820 [compost metagenome]